jgi:hypothetical protein
LIPLRSGRVSRASADYPHRRCARLLKIDDPRRRNDRAADYLRPIAILQLEKALPISAISRRRTPAEGYGDWLFQVVVEERGERALLRVSLSETQRCLAGIREPSAGWVEERLQALARARLAGGEPVIDQVRTWRQPIPLFAPPR